MFRSSMTAALAAIGLIVSGCGDDNPTAPGSSTNFRVSIENISSMFDVMSSGVFNTPVGSGSAGPIASGAAYEFDFTAGPGAKLSVASMFVQSNDLFYAPDANGIDLFDNNGNQITGDVTSQLQLWDAGTEENQFPGVGADQAPRQGSGNTGLVDGNANVRQVSDGFTYPSVTDAVRLTLSSTGATSFRGRLEVVAPTYRFPTSGVANTPVGSGSAGPIGPGQAYEYSFYAAPGAKLSFAHMFIPSNDFFYGPDENGIALFDNSNNPISGDVTSQVSLWDAGTEADQEPGLGADQAPRQAGANTGAVDGNNTVRLAADTFNNLPAVGDVIKVTITSTPERRFTVRIENVSTSTTLTTSDTNTQSVPLAPGAWVVHTDASPLFTSGQADNGDGLEALAEDGGVTTLNTWLAGNTGISVVASPGLWVVHSGTAPLFTSGQTDNGSGLEALAEDGDPAGLNTSVTAMAGVSTPLSPGLWTVHTTDGPIFTVDQADRSLGLESIAEDGDPATLQTSLTGQTNIQSVGIFNTPAGAGSAGPIAGGSSYEFTVSAVSGDRLSFALMYIQSNDLFIGPDGVGIDLFPNGQPLSGDITSQLQLWDAGTEVNEEPGVGLNQAPRQVGADTGTDENGTVRVVNDSFSYPSLSSIIRVTVTPQ